MTATTILAAPVEPAWRLHPSKLSVVAAAIKKMVPYLVEATLIPTVLSTPSSSR